MNSNQSIIKLKDIIFSYPGSDINIIDHLDLDIKNGERLGMMAPNGSGKTTLLHTIMGLCKPDSGVIEIFGNQINHENDFIPKAGYIHCGNKACKK